MAILDDPLAFYGPAQDDWSLGDLVIVPTIILWAKDEKPPGTFLVPPPPPDGSDSVILTLWNSVEGLPAPVAELWGPPRS